MYQYRYEPKDAADIQKYWGRRVRPTCVYIYIYIYIYICACM